MYKMKRLEVSGAVRPIYGSLGVKRLMFCVDAIAGCSEIHKKFSSSLSKQKAKFIKVKFGGSLSNH